MSPRPFFFFLFLMFPAGLFFWIIGCCGISTDASVKPLFKEYEKTALVWQGHNEQIYESLFLTYWLESFPKQTVVERKDLRKVVREQNLLPGRLNETTRARLRQILGVNAIILAQFSITGRRRLFDERQANFSIKVIDTATGEISASTVSQGHPKCSSGIILEAVKTIKDRMKMNVYSTSPFN